MLTISDFFLTATKTKIISKWKNEEYNNNPLLITGSKGNGKTSLSEIILKDYKIININIDFIKKKLDLKNYLDMSLGKKNISMMFNSKNTHLYKAIVFDDIEIILKEDKSLLKNILEFLKYMDIYKKNLIIFILNEQSICKAKFSGIIKVCDIINIKHDHKTFSKIVNNILNKEEMIISMDNIKNIIHKSNNNINNLKANIDFLKNKNNTINTDVINFNDINCEINGLTNILLNNKFNIENIFKIVFNDYNIISLNILDNLYRFFDKFLIDDYINIYKYICDGDKYNSYMIIEHNYYLINYIIMFKVLFPLFKIKNNCFKKVTDIGYNKYISKTIYCISNYNIYIKNNIDLMDIYYELYLYDHKFIKNNKINKKILEKYIKNYNWIYGRKITKKNIY